MSNCGKGKRGKGGKKKRGRVKIARWGKTAMKKLPPPMTFYKSYRQGKWEGVLVSSG